MRCTTIQVTPTPGLGVWDVTATMLRPSETSNTTSSLLWGHSELGYGKSRAISHGGRRGRRGWGDFGKELVVAWPML
uniref:Uncharacterized protein n=1 Tax=Oryza barthii TaxID=65489 RepID=A0A0D3GYP7_9ORYZ